jgi:hypothetical protein
MCNASFQAFTELMFQVEVFWVVTGCGSLKLRPLNIIRLSRLISKNLKIKIYKTVILPVVLYGCETWSLILREERRLRASENRMLRRIFGPKREEDGSWRKLHNDELRGLYSSPNIIRVIKSPRCRWEDNIKMDLREIGIDGANWIRLAQDRVQWQAFVNTVMYFRVP